MSILWREVPGGGWQEEPISDYAASTGDLQAIRFFHFGSGSERRAALLAKPEVQVRVNGQPIFAGLRLLEHKDEILWGKCRWSYSAERKPVVEKFALGSGRTPACPVCRGAINNGELAVQCPGCRRWYHQSDAVDGNAEKKHWSYAPTCRFCNHPTALSGESIWRPDMEEANV